MGESLSNPIANCCCTTSVRVNDTATIGQDGATTTSDGYLYSKIDRIVRIQAFLKGKFHRMRYLKLREERRKMSTHFLIEDQLETITSKQKVELRLLFDSSEAELESRLTVATYQYAASQSTYEGQWMGGFRHGRGVMTFRDGATFDGTWYLGRAHGYGKFTHVQGETYEGDWADDMRHGLGEMVQKYGVKYRGKWFKNGREGVGAEILSETHTFHGNFKHGKKNGYGIYKWPDGATYEGNWVDSKITGFGIYKWADGRMFTGEWVNCKTGGFGVYNWPDGRRYEGFFTRDKRQGYGMLMSPNNYTYSGGWLNGKQHGYGFIYTDKGEFRYGMWVNGQKILKLTTEEATEVQEGRMDLYSVIKKKKNVEDPVQYWQDIQLLTKKFEPFDSFQTEQGIFELKYSRLQELYQELKEALQEQEIVS